MKKNVFIHSAIVFCMFSTGLNAQIQQELDQFNRERININKTGMAILTGWSLANIAGGGIGYFTAEEGEAKYFHQMNGLWGIINAAFGGAGLLQAMSDKKSYDFEKTVKQQNGIEKTFLFNSALDLVYVTAGFYLIENGKVEPDKKAKYTGWGNSIILQGGFLCLFDVMMFVHHNRHGNKKLTPIIQRATFTMNSDGIGIKYRF